MGTGPSSKETTLHHYRDPLAAHLAADPDIDFPGVILQATSDVFLHKRFVSRRTAALVGGLGADGAIVCIDAWGNAHIDFAATIEYIGQQGIPVVGLSFVGIQAAFVVTNPHMDSIVDLNKTVSGVEPLILGQNTVEDLDAVKAIAIMKNKLRRNNPEREYMALPERQLRSLQVRHFRLLEALEAERTAIEGATLLLNLPALRKKVMDKVAARESLLELVENMTVALVRPMALHPEDGGFFCNSLLDVMPIAAKVEGVLGEGVTHLLEGVQMMLTTADVDGFQPINAGAASGAFREVVRLGRPGTPAPEDYIIHVDVILKKGEASTREGIMAAHLACDEIALEIRNLLRELNRYQAAQRRRLADLSRPGRPRIALVKMTSGVSAMGDTAVFPDDPGGFIGSHSIMDYTHNLPIFFSCNEYMDGIVHSLS